MSHLRNKGKLSLLIVMVITITITSLGCESLRKKFVRQKKKDVKDKDFIPVLDPIEYPASVHTPEDDYKHAYGLWKVWNTEFLQEINVNQNDKRQVYLLTEAINQLQEMDKVVVGQKKDALEEVIKNLNAVKDEFKTPAPMRSLSTIKSRVERNAKTISSELHPRLMKDYLVTQ